MALLDELKSTGKGKAWQQVLIKFVSSTPLKTSLYGFRNSKSKGKEENLNAFVKVDSVSDPICLNPAVAVRLGLATVDGDVYTAIAKASVSVLWGEFGPELVMTEAKALPSGTKKALK